MLLRLKNMVAWRVFDMHLDIMGREGESLDNGNY